MAATKSLGLLAVHATSQGGVDCLFSCDWLKDAPLAHAEMSADEALYLASQLTEAVRKAKKVELT